MGGAHDKLDRKRWEEIQQGEFAYHEAKDETRVLERNLPYWRSLIGALPAEVGFDASTRAVDLGCGGCGILLALEQGELIGVDPLMERYLAKFPFLGERSDIRWVSGTAEEVELDGEFDVVFSINALDHVYDPGHVAKRVAGMLRPGGHFVLTMNCHNTQFFRDYYSMFYRVIDHHHPFQFTPKGVEALFSELTPVQVRPIDDLWFPHAEAYYRDVLHRPFRSRKKLLRAAMNPFKWPMGFCKLLLNMPPHAKRPGQRSIYSNYLFVLRKGA